MIDDTLPARATAPEYQHAALKVRFGRRARLAVRVDVTNEGLLAIGALVSSILLSTAVLVGVAVQRPDQRRRERDAIDTKD
jgi:hypothetical protein